MRSAGCWKKRLGHRLFASAVLSLMSRVTLTLSHSLSWRGFSSSSSYVVPGSVKLSTVRWARFASAAQAQGRQQSPSSAPLNLRVAGFNLQMEQFEGILAPLRALEGYGFSRHGVLPGS